MLLLLLLLLMELKLVHGFLGGKMDNGVAGVAGGGREVHAELEEVGKVVILRRHEGFPMQVIRPGERRVVVHCVVW